MLRGHETWFLLNNHNSLCAVEIPPTRPQNIGGYARTRGDFVGSFFFFIFAPQLSQESAVVTNLSSYYYVSTVNKPRVYIISIITFSIMDKTKTIEDLRHAIDEMSIIMYNIYVEWKVSQSVPLTESERMAENMYRMMIFKAKSIGLMSQGVVITPTQKGIIPDPSTIYPVLRSMYELLFLFRCLFVSSRNDLERELLLNLWKIRGYNNLIRIPDKELNKEYKDEKEFAKV